MHGCWASQSLACHAHGTYQGHAQFVVHDRLEGGEAHLSAAESSPTFGTVAKCHGNREGWSKETMKSADIHMTLVM